MQAKSSGGEHLPCLSMGPRCPAPLLVMPPTRTASQSRAAFAGPCLASTRRPLRFDITGAGATLADANMWIRAMRQHTAKETPNQIMDRAEAAMQVPQRKGLQHRPPAQRGRALRE